jgi:hypothetical protein
MLSCADRGVSVGVDVGVRVGVPVLVGVQVRVSVGVLVGVAVAVLVRVDVGVRVDVSVLVAVPVCVAMADFDRLGMRRQRKGAAQPRERWARNKLLLKSILITKAEILDYELTELARAVFE